MGQGTVPKEEKIEPQPAKPGYYLVEKEDVNQSSISMLGLGIRRDNPDYYAVRVFNEVFGGGFSSRLMQSIRTAKGWPMRSEAASAVHLTISALCDCRWGPRAAARSKRFRRWMSRLTVSPRIQFRKRRSSEPRIPS